MLTAGIFTFIGIGILVIARSIGQKIELTGIWTEFAGDGIQKIVATILGFIKKSLDNKKLTVKIKYKVTEIEFTERDIKQYKVIFKEVKENENPVERKEADEQRTNELAEQIADDDTQGMNPSKSRRRQGEGNGAARYMRRRDGPSSGAYGGTAPDSSKTDAGTHARGKREPCRLGRAGGAAVLRLANRGGYQRKADGRYRSSAFFRTIARGARRHPGRGNRLPRVLA